MQLKPWKDIFRSIMIFPLYDAGINIKPIMIIYDCKCLTVSGLHLYNNKNNLMESVNWTELDDISNCCNYPYQKKKVLPKPLQSSLTAAMILLIPQQTHGKHCVTSVSHSMCFLYPDIREKSCKSVWQTTRFNHLVSVKSSGISQRVPQELIWVIRGSKVGLAKKPQRVTWATFQPSTSNTNWLAPNTLSVKREENTWDGSRGFEERMELQTTNSIEILPASCCEKAF